MSAKTDRIREQFVQQTGFQFERDLDKAAFAVHYPASWGGGGTGVEGWAEPSAGIVSATRVATHQRVARRDARGYGS